MLLSDRSSELPLFIDMHRLFVRDLSSLLDTIERVIELETEEGAESEHTIHIRSGIDEKVSGQ
jgi:hypothetical protein